MTIPKDPATSDSDDLEILPENMLEESRQVFGVDRVVIIDETTTEEEMEEAFRRLLQTDEEKT